MRLRTGTGRGVRVDEAGFSLIEVVLAAALFALVALATFEAVRQVGGNAQALTAHHLAYAGLERLTSQLRAEARSATAIWTSSPAAGSGHDDCVQLDFFAADASGPAFWSYRAFPNHTPAERVPGDALERLAGPAPIPPCDPSYLGGVVLVALQGPPAVATIGAAALASHRDPYLGRYDSPFVASTVPATPPVALGVLDARGGAVSGGNAVVELRIETAQASRVVDLLPGVMPNGFTEVLRYTCTARCDVGHDGAVPKTLTSCAMSWGTGWSEYLLWNDYAVNPDGTLTFPGGWFIAGTFVFTYSGTRSAGGATDTLVRPYVATNWDAARNYAAAPPDRPAPDGSRAGSFTPWDVRSETAAPWLTDFEPYLAAGEAAAIDAEKQRCDAVQQQGTTGGFYANG